jgi:hypothetical protein
MQRKSSTSLRGSAVAVKFASRMSRPSLGLIPGVDVEALLTASVREESLLRNAISGQENTYWAMLCGAAAEKHEHQQLVNLMEEEARCRDGIGGNITKEVLAVSFLEQRAFSQILESSARAIICRQEQRAWCLLYKQSQSYQLLALEHLESAFRRGLADLCGNFRSGVECLEEQHRFFLQERSGRIRVLHVQGTEQMRLVCKRATGREEILEMSARTGLQWLENRDRTVLAEYSVRSSMLIEELSVYRNLQRRYVVQSERVHRVCIGETQEKDLRSFDGAFLLIRGHLAAHHDAGLQRKRFEIQTRLSDLEAKLSVEYQSSRSMYHVRNDDSRKQKEKISEEIREILSSISDLEYQAERAGKKEVRKIQGELAAKRERLAKLEDMVNRLAQQVRNEVERLQRIRTLDVDEEVLSGKKSAVVKNLEAEAESLRNEQRTVVEEYVRRFMESSAAQSPATIPTRHLEPPHTQRQSFSRLQQEEGSPKTPLRAGSARRRQSLNGDSESWSTPLEPSFSRSGSFARRHLSPDPAVPIPRISPPVERSSRSGSLACRNEPRSPAVNLSLPPVGGRRVSVGGK